jgi:putative serine protease PepD
VSGRSLPRHRYVAALVVLVAAAITVATLLLTARGGDESTAAVPVQDAGAGFAQVVSKALPSVVQIRTRGGLGSGVVYDDGGHVVTNAHVVAGFHSFTVTLADGSRHSAKLTGVFGEGDLAVVQISGAQPPAATFADSSGVQVGDYALAIGNPLGLSSSVTQGIVSSTSRTVSEGGGIALPSVIQTSAPINPGNSGGALVDASGAVIGIPTLAAADPELGGTADGIGFAISSNTVRSIAGQLIADGRVRHSGRSYLGVQLRTMSGVGAMVAATTPNGPAARAGIRSGDVIVSVAGQPTPTVDDLAEALAQTRPHANVAIGVRGSSGTRTVRVTLGELP